jgi:uncharacterized membrane protein YbhN (UPF0104 family)
MQLETDRQGLGRLARFIDPRGLNHAKAKRVMLGVAVLFLLVGIAISLDSNPEVLSDLDWRPVLVLVLVAVPVTIMLNAYEFVLIGRLVGREIGMPAAIEISIIGTAANLLPLPGATMVRVAALKAAGAGYGEGTKATLLVAGLWAGIAFVFAGAWMVRLSLGPTAVLFVVIGLAAWLGCFLASMRRCQGVELPVLLSLAKLLLVVTDVFRIYLCFLALGEDAHFAQVAAFAVAGVVGSAVSIVPAGLGVREAVSAALAPLVGLGAGMAFLAASLNRLLGLITVVPLAIGILLSGRGRAVGEDTAA